MNKEFITDKKLPEVIRKYKNYSFAFSFIISANKNENIIIFLFMIILTAFLLSPVLLKINDIID